MIYFIFLYKEKIKKYYFVYDKHIKKIKIKNNNKKI